MVRAILCFLEIFLFLVLALPVLLVFWIWKKKDPKRAAEEAQKWIAWILGCLRDTAAVDLTVIGMDRVPKEGGLLFVSNHRSFFDIIIAYSIVPRQTGFVAKNGLWKVPSLRRWMQVLNCFFLDRQDIRQGLEVVKGAIQKVKEGTCIWICPEGTRNRNRELTDLLPFHEGSFKIAERSGCQIVPVAFYGTDRIWEAQFPWVKPQKITVEFGEPFRVSELSPEWKKHYGEYTRGVIGKMLVAEAVKRGDPVPAEAEGTQETQAR